MGRKEGSCLTVEGVTASKVTRTLSLSPLRGKAAGKHQPRRGKQERGAAAPTCHNAPTDTRGSKQPKRKPNQKTHSEKPCVPSPNQSCLSLQPSPQKLTKAFFLQLFYFFFPFIFFSKSLWFFGLQVADQLAAFPSPFASLLGSSHGRCLVPHIQLWDGTAKLVQSSPRGWTKDTRPGKILLFFREEN